MDEHEQVVHDGPPTSIPQKRASWTDVFKDENTGSYSHSKIGVVIAGAMFCLKMSGLVPSMPDDSMLWLTFMSTIGGYAALLRVIRSRSY